MTFPLTIARGALSRAGELFDLQRKVMVVTGEGVPQQYARAVLSRCGDGHLLILPEGEGNKTLASVETILNALLEQEFTRSDAVVAVGGGVIGDTAGFAAACYMRGIDWYNVPTTLLSQADSSVGGKTGVNLAGVKNIVGAFRQPAGVLIDPDVLDTLSPRLFAEGLAEIIKMAASCDADLFRILEETGELRPRMEEILERALRIKLRVVEEDPTEQGIRAVLNFGHTIGHAIEAACVGHCPPEPIKHGQKGPGGQCPTQATAFYHGEAVAVGMLYMSSGEARERIGALLRRFGLPTEDPFSAEELMTFAMHDKKKRGNGIKIVTVDTIGSYNFKEIDAEELENIIKARKI